MAVTITIPPALIMGIIPVRRDDLIKNPLQVPHTAGLKFKGRYPAGCRWGKYSGYAMFYLAAPNTFSDLFGDIPDISITVRFQRYGMRFN